VEFLASVLLLGLIGLFVLERRQAGRLNRLERELASLRASLSRATPLDPGSSASEPAQQPSSTLPQGGQPILSTWFERVVAGRLLIWTGGVALAAGGVFLIRHSIELVTPGARMIAAALLGFLLIGAGEGARRGRLLSGDPRTAQALVGAGIAVLYATAYGSHALFALIGSGTAAMLIVLVTAAALLLSLRHGAPTAALGIVGGFSAPLLVGEPEAGALPVLFYVTLLDAAIFFIASRRRWGWLVAAAVAASFAWTGYYILLGPEDALAAGFFAALFGIAASLPRSGPKPRPWLLAPAIVALVQLAVLVGRGDAGTPAWLLFAALAAVSLPLAALRTEHRALPGAALLIALALLAVKAALRNDPLVPWAAAITTLLFSLGSVPAIASGRTAAALTACGALAGPLLILRLLRPDLLTRPGYGLLALSLAIAALALLWAMRPRPQNPARSGAGAFELAGTAALLAAIGAYDIVPPDFVSAAWLLLSIALLLAGVRLAEKALRVAGLALLTLTVFKAFLIDAAALQGVLRILSFLGLGVALIGIGVLYGKLLAPANKKETATT
jgi:hypothetical protein